jgi:GT2 family glycosyltransferase
MIRNKFPNVKLIENSKNIFFSKANNQALQIASGEYVLLCNSDIIVLKNAIKNMISHLMNEQRIGAVTCSLLNRDGSLSTRCWSFHNPQKLFFMFYPFVLMKESLKTDKLSTPKKEIDQSAEVITDGFMLAKRKALNDIGFYDERFKLYFTEDDLCRRLKDAEWNVKYLGSIQVIHKGAQSAKKLTRMKLRWIFINDMLVYVKKYFNMCWFVLFCILGFIDILIVGIYVAFKTSNTKKYINQ